MPDILAYVPHPDDPERPPDWRWERARWLNAHRRHVRKQGEDPWILMARKFQADEARCHTPFDREALLRKYPGIYWAHELYRRRDHGSSAVEGYLLGRAEPETIAGYCHSRDEIITWYEKLFFNVVPLLKHDTYIVNVVMGREVHFGLSDKNYGLFWKMYGYGLGHIALRTYVRPFLSQFVRSEDQVAGAEDADIGATIRRKTLVAVHTMPVYQNHLLIVEAYNRCKEIQRLGGESAGTEALILSHCQAALCALPFVVGKGGPMDLPRLSYYDGQGVELRAREQLLVAMGHETEEHRRVVSWKYPEATEVAPT